jgi:hypothetical protein
MGDGNLDPQSWTADQYQVVRRGLANGLIKDPSKASRAKSAADWYQQNKLSGSSDTGADPQPGQDTFPVKRAPVPKLPIATGNGEPISKTSQNTRSDSAGGLAAYRKTLELSEPKYGKPYSEFRDSGKASTGPDTLETFGRNTRDAATLGLGDKMSSIGARVAGAMSGNDEPVTEGRGLNAPQAADGTRYDNIRADERARTAAGGGMHPIDAITGKGPLMEGPHPIAATLGQIAGSLAAALATGGSGAPEAAISNAAKPLVKRVGGAVVRGAGEGAKFGAASGLGHTDIGSDQSAGSAAADLATNAAVGGVEGGAGGGLLGGGLESILSIPRGVGRRSWESAQDVSKNPQTGPTVGAAAKAGVEPMPWMPFSGREGDLHPGPMVQEHLDAAKAPGNLSPASELAANKAALTARDVLHDWESTGKEHTAAAEADYLGRREAQVRTGTGKLVGELDKLIEKQRFTAKPTKGAPAVADAEALPPDDVLEGAGTPSDAASGQRRIAQDKAVQAANAAAPATDAEWMYHATAASNMDDIAARGLDPKQGGKNYDFAKNRDRIFFSPEKYQDDWHGNIGDVTGGGPVVKLRTRQPTQAQEGANESVRYRREHTAVEHLEFKDPATGEWRPLAEWPRNAPALQAKDIINAGRAPARLGRTLPPKTESTAAAAQPSADLPLGKRVRLEDIRAKLGHLPRAEQDKLLIDAQNRGDLILMRMDDPTDITAATEAAKLKVAGNDRHIAYLEKPMQIPSTPAERPAPAGYDAIKARLEQQRAQADAPAAEAPPVRKQAMRAKDIINEPGDSGTRGARVDLPYSHVKRLRALRQKLEQADGLDASTFKEFAKAIDSEAESSNRPALKADLEHIRRLMVGTEDGSIPGIRAQAWPGLHKIQVEASKDIKRQGGIRETLGATKRGELGPNDVKALAQSTASTKAQVMQALDDLAKEYPEIADLAIAARGTKAYEQMVTKPSKGDSKATAIMARMIAGQVLPTTDWMVKGAAPGVLSRATRGMKNLAPPTRSSAAAGGVAGGHRRKSNQQEAR